MTSQFFWDKPIFKRFPIYICYTIVEDNSGRSLLLLGYKNYIHSIMCRTIWFPVNGIMFRDNGTIKRWSYLEEVRWWNRPWDFCLYFFLPYLFLIPDGLDTSKLLPPMLSITVVMPFPQGGKVPSNSEPKLIKLYSTKLMFSTNLSTELRK